MYTVRFTQKVVSNSFRPVIFQSEDVETAVKCALAVHEISNVSHEVTVCQESDDPQIFREVLTLQTITSHDEA